MFGNVNQVEVTQRNDGYDYTRILYPSMKKETELEGYFLSGFDEAHKLDDNDSVILHSVAGSSQKVVCPKKLIEYNGKNIYDKFESCELCDENAEVKALNENKSDKERINLPNRKGIEVFIPMFLTKVSWFELDKDGTKGEWKEETPNEIVLIGTSITDLFFAGGKGVGKQLNAFMDFETRSKKKEKKNLISHKIKYMYGKIEFTDDKLSDEELEVQNLIASLRDDKNLMERFEGRLPISYKEYFENKYNQKYYTNKELKDLEKKGLKPDVTPLDKQVEEIDLDAPF